MFRIRVIENSDIGVIVNNEVERLRVSGIKIFRFFEYCYVKEGMDFFGVFLE